jgi:dolichol-phosphate mannosyltransferase
MSDNLYIVMPAYNEEANIEEIVKHWHNIVEKTGSNSRLVIINDGSTDSTYEIMLGLKGRYSQFIPVTKPNSGHGSTCLFAYSYGINAGADYIFQTDSDGQTNPEEFWQFWESRNQYDFQIGDRTLRQDGFDRVVIMHVLRFILWIIFGQWVKDANAPFRLMKTEHLIPILKKIPVDFFLCNVVITTIALKWKERIKWHTISFKPRQGGVNSINLGRIFKIGRKALGDFSIINKNLKN